MPISVTSQPDAHRDAGDEDAEPGDAEPEAEQEVQRRRRPAASRGTRSQRTCARPIRLVPTLQDDVRRPLREAPGHPRPTSAARGTLTEDDINKAMREIRLALLEADVNFKVVKQFTANGQGAGARRRRDRPAQPGPAGRQDRQRGADGAHGRRRGRGLVLAAAADRDPDGRPAGLGQDDGHGQARPPPARGARLVGRGRRLRRLPPGRGRPARQGRRAGRRRRSTSRAPTATRSTSPRWALDRAKQRGQGRADRRHERPPARRRGADGRARATSARPSSRTTSCWSSTR